MSRVAQGLATRALLTDMDEPLASAAGNAVEIAYAIDYLTGRGREPRFHEVTVALGAEMLRLGGLTGSAGEGRDRIAEAVASGAAAERFARMVAALGGPSDLVERPNRHLAAAPVVVRGRGGGGRGSSRRSRPAVSGSRSLRSAAGEAGLNSGSITRSG